MYPWMPGADTGWVAVADFSPLRVTITRLAVSTDSTQIALVGEITL